MSDVPKVYYYNYLTGMFEDNDEPKTAKTNLTGVVTLAEYEELAGNFDALVNEYHELKRQHNTLVDKVNYLLDVAADENDTDGMQ